MPIQDQPKCPATALGRSECGEYIRSQMSQIGDEIGEGCEVVVSTAAPLVDSPYGANGYTCPHGVTYWIEPTSEQITAWNAAGVK